MLVRQQQIQVKFTTPAKAKVICESQMYYYPITLYFPSYMYFDAIILYFILSYMLSGPTQSNLQHRPKGHVMSMATTHHIGGSIVASPTDPIVSFCPLSTMACTSTTSTLVHASLYIIHPKYNVYLPFQSLQCTSTIPPPLTCTSTVNSYILMLTLPHIPLYIFLAYIVQCSFFLTHLCKLFPPLPL